MKQSRKLRGRVRLVVVLAAGKRRQLVQVYSASTAPPSVPDL
ncbi:MAG TPA: hypothetical protein VHT68_15765 [Pseudolabrys sp.]|nr:hypothetical protein [Pseudolabrys sp.]